MHNNDMNLDEVGIIRGRLETELSIEIVSTKEAKKRPRSKGHELDKIASTVEAGGQPHRALWSTQRAQAT